MAAKYRTGTDLSITGRNALKSAIMGLYFALALIRSCVTGTALASTANSPPEFDARSRVRFTRVGVRTWWGMRFALGGTLLLAIAPFRCNGCNSKAVDRDDFASRIAMRYPS